MMPLFFLLLIALVIAASIAHHKRGRSMLEDWAARNGFALISAEECWLWRGPFWLRSGKGNVVYRVTVRDRDGLQRSGYVRCGGFFLGMWSDAVAVEWD